MLSFYFVVYLLGGVLASIEPLSDFDTNEFFDFIIVGGGTAGCVVASRLSENPDWKVLLLEAGDDEKLEYDIPGMPSLFRPEINWGYQTAPNNYSCLSRAGKSCPVPRGKVLGGSSVLNFMIYFRGNKQDYNEWSDLGNEGWSFEEVLPYFKMSEDNGDNHIASNKHYHSVGGYQHVKAWDYEDDNVARIIRGFNEIGFKTADLNGMSQNGVMVTQFSQLNSTRMSSNTAFIKPAKDRKNLKVVLRSLVTKVIIEPYGRSALGVEIADGNKKVRIWSKKEVIVSAGAIDSAKLLMLSGIGLKKNLEHLNISVIKEAHVGENYYDHVTFGGLTYHLSDFYSTFRSEHKIKDDLSTWYENRTGPLGSMGPIAVGAFINTKNITGNEPPNIQYIIDGFYTDEKHTNISSLLTLQKPLYKLPYYNNLNIKPILLRPKSVGTITLNKEDPIYGKPILNTNFLKDDDDVETLVDGVEIALKLLDTIAFRSMGAKRKKFDVGLCNAFENREYWKCVVKHFTGTIYHPVGTCKMGPKSDATSVVDSRLRVHDVDRLRVIDASVMPKPVRSNTNAPTVMIAEKGARMIKDDWSGFYY